MTGAIGALIQGAQATPPGPATAVSVSTTSTAAQDLSAFEGKYVVMIADVKTHVRFGTSSVGAATTNDFYLPADTPLQFYIPPSGHRSYFRAVAEDDGTLHVADASDPA